ncbi:hypothetical protein [Yoonia sp. 208BN28-4]|uniref:hypothetical protein n=1 Tax=Yoonia sp. 208BN28-4 TaxID=3126505 RepID=UPI0030B5E632
MSPKVIESSSFSDFINQVCSVTPKTHPPGRATADAREFWILQRAISNIIEETSSRKWRLIHQDKPDFLLEIDEALVGIEVTEAVPQSLAQFMSFENEQIYAPMKFWREQSGAKRDRIRQMAAESLKEAGIGSDESERLLSELICKRIADKTKKLEDGAIKKYTKNHLVIYDRGSPAGTKLDRVVSLILKNPKLVSTFDQVVLVSDGSCVNLRYQN